MRGGMARKGCLMSTAEEIFNQYFLHRAKPKTLGPEIDSMCSFNVATPVPSWLTPLARLCG